MDTNVTGRARRKRRIRKKVFGTGERPRLSVFRSAKHMYAQIIDDTTGQTVVSTSTTTKGFGIDGDKTAEAKAIGVAIAQAARERGIEKVVFDRNGYIYHGRVKALADGAREGGLNF